MSVNKYCKGMQAIMRNIIKILYVILLVLGVTGCELFDPKFHEEARERARERGQKCYEYRSGYIHCEDKDGNTIW